MNDKIEALLKLSLGANQNDDFIIHVEVLQSPKSSATKTEIELCVRDVLRQKEAVMNNFVFNQSTFRNQFLKDHVEKISITAIGLSASAKIIVNQQFMSSCRVHVYQVISDDPSMEDLSNDTSDEPISVGRKWTLPNKEFEGMWDSLVYDDDVKEQMLNYAESMLLFADKKVDPHVVTCNRMILFHGPPGTGKTTLCKAIAQKLCVRMNDRYRCGRFLEVNSHSLFSKWFSESGKLVTKMFAHIHDMLEDESTLVIVLIDEVESLTVARKQALDGNEPSDAVRVVNALLTQLDYIRRWPNVLVLTTSNIAESVDPAFLDRADIQQYIGPPSPIAIYGIFYEAILELQRIGIISATKTQLPALINHIGNDAELLFINSKLLEISQRCHGLSGRTIRKLPLLAHAFKLATHKTVTLDMFVDALAYAASKHWMDKAARSSENSRVIVGPVVEESSSSCALSPTRKATTA